MKWILDAQLPRRLAWWIRQTGQDALHTLDLPDGNRTRDDDIIELARRQGRIVVTKDVDFVDSFLLSRRLREIAGHHHGQHHQFSTGAIAPATFPSHHRGV